LRHAFTVDVEDWYHGIPIPAESKARAERRLEHGLDRLLALLAEHRVRGTFYILGPVARDHPSSVRAIAEQGHEIGCHGWSHDLLYTMSPGRFEDETRRAQAIIEDVTGLAVRSYRAAYFPITRASWWALETLAGLGFDTDSSIFPVRNWRYGIPDFPPRPTWIDTAKGAILEVPLGVRRIGRFQVPVTGGAYLRLYPYAVSRANLRAIERTGKPHVFYLHPWELDPDHPRVPFHWKARLTHYANLRSTAPKLSRLLKEFEFGTIDEVFRHEHRDASSAAL